MHSMSKFLVYCEGRYTKTFIVLLFIFFLLCIIILFVCFILCFALLCFYVSLHYVLPALQLIVHAWYLWTCMCYLCLYVNVLYLFLCNIYICRVVKWNEHFTESAIFPLRQCCIYKVGNPLVESSGFYIEVID
jgi:hypothetical protein